LGEDYAQKDRKKTWKPKQAQWDGGRRGLGKRFFPIEAKNEGKRGGGKGKFEVEITQSIYQEKKNTQNWFQLHTREKNRRWPGKRKKGGRDAGCNRSLKPTYSKRGVVIKKHTKKGPWFLSQPKRKSENRGGEGRKKIDLPGLLFSAKECSSGRNGIGRGTLACFEGDGRRWGGGEGSGGALRGYDSDGNGMKRGVKNFFCNCHRI